MPASDRLTAALQSLEKIRGLVEAVRPARCCAGTTAVAGGTVQQACSLDCAWQELDLQVATAIVYVETSAEAP